MPPANQNRNAIARLQKITDEHQAALRSASATEGDEDDDEEDDEDDEEDEEEEDELDDDGLDFPSGEEGDEVFTEDTEDDNGGTSGGDEYTTGEESEAEESGTSGGSDSAAQLEFDDTETELPLSFREMQRQHAASRQQQQQPSKGALRQPRVVPLRKPAAFPQPTAFPQQQMMQPRRGLRVAPLNPTPQGTAIFKNALDEYLETARSNMHGGFGTLDSGAGNDNNSGTMVGLTRASRESSDRAEYLLRLEQLRQSTGMQMHFTADMTSGQLYNMLRRYTELATQNADLDRVLETLATFAEAIQAINDENNFLPMDKYNLHVRAACSKPTFRYAVTQLLRRYRGTGAFDPTREVLLTLLMPVMYAVIQKLAMWFTRSSASMQKIARRVSTAFQAFTSLAIGTNPEPYIPGDTPGIYVEGNRPPRQRDLAGAPATMTAPPDSSDDDDDNDFVDASSAPPPPPPQRAPAQMPVHAPVQVPVHAPVQVPVQAPVQVPVQAPVQVPVQAPMQQQQQTLYGPPPHLQQQQQQQQPPPQQPPQQQPRQQTLYGPPPHLQQQQQQQQMQMQVQYPQPAQLQQQQQQPPLITGQQLLQQQMMQRPPPPPAMTQSSTDAELQEYARQTQQQQQPQRLPPATVRQNMPIQIALPPAAASFEGEDDGVSLVPPS